MYQLVPTLVPTFTYQSTASPFSFLHCGVKQAQNDNNDMKTTNFIIPHLKRRPCSIVTENKVLLHRKLELQCYLFLINDVTCHSYIWASKHGPNIVNVYTTQSFVTFEYLNHNFNYGHDPIKML